MEKNILERPNHLSRPRHISIQLLCPRKSPIEQDLRHRIRHLLHHPRPPHKRPSHVFCTPRAGCNLVEQNLHGGDTGDFELPLCQQPACSGDGEDVLACVAERRRLKGSFGPQFGWNGVAQSGLFGLGFLLPCREICFVQLG